MFQPGDTLADRFKLERLAGTGAMGQVWLARSQDGGEPLAIKLLAKDERGLHAARFLREAVLLSQLDHPRIVRYVAHGLTPDGEPYLVMEWLEGEDLARRLHAGPLTVEETIALVRYVAEALAAAHDAGIVHRDIKPSNLFLPHGAIDAVKVVDFGIARVKDSTWTKTGLLLGTPAYMSPEQAYGQREIDARADLFGLGCVAFECATGRVAFGGKQVFAILRRILLEDAPSISETLPDVPPELEALVKRMMAKDPADRPQSAAEVATQLAALAQGLVGGSTRASVALRRRAVLSEREQCIVTMLSLAEDVGTLGTIATTAIEVLQPGPDQLDPTGTLRGLLERTGGRVARCTANASVLVFPAGGVPTDRAVQAAECALSLRGVFRGRDMALASGRTELGAWTDSNAAARASELVTAHEARPDHAQRTGILLDELTAGLLDARFDVTVGPRGLELRGDLEPTNAGEAAPAEATTPFVGREREVDAIMATFEECIDEPVARVALVTGPAGMGKSRLRRELVSRAPRVDGMQIWTARGEPLHAGSPFGLITQLLRCARSEFPDAEAIGPHSQQAFVDFIARECEGGPLWVMLEDLQWGDALSIKLLDTALRELPDSPWMVTAFARPEVHQLFPKLWADRAIEEIRLTPLTRGASERLVRAILASGTSAAEEARILEQADGVPFYLSALARTAARGDPHIPEPVLAMVQTRFERFDAHTRRVLRAASVFGRTFWRGGVLSLVGAVEIDDALRDLVEAKLIAKCEGSRYANDVEYEFCSTLICESAYAMLIEADRVLGHDRAAEWLEGSGEQDTAVILRHRRERHAAG